MSRRKPTQTRFDAHGRQRLAQYLTRFPTGRSISRNENDRHPPMTTHRRTKPYLSNRRLVDPRPIPLLRRNRVRKNSLRSTRHRMGSDTQCGVTPFERFYITHPRRTENIFSSRLQLLDEKASERIGSSRAVAVHNDNFVGTGALGTANSSVHFGGEKTTSFLINFTAARTNLFPVDDATNPFHVAPKHHAHRDKTLHKKKTRRPLERKGAL